MMLRLSPDAIALDPRRVLLALRCPVNGQTAPLIEVAERAIARARALAAPCTVWRRFPLSAEAGRPVLPAAIELPGRDIAAHLADCTCCILSATTLGMAVERELLRLAPAPAEALYFDAACNLLAEAAADAAETEILREIPHRRATFRYAPGYGDLPLTIQPQLLAVLDAGRQLGLQVIDGGMMVPRKSITGIVGLEQ